MNNVYDEYGCCGSCGYTWCEVLNQCVRLWETECSSHRRLTVLSDFNISELGIFIGVCSSAIVGILIATQKSKCKTCCWGCIERDVDAVIKEERLKATGNTGDTPQARKSQRLQEKQIKLDLDTKNEKP